MTTPRNVTAMAKQAYGFALRTGKTLSTMGDYEIAVSLRYGFVAVVLTQESKWIVPIKKTWN